MIKEAPRGSTLSGLWALLVGGPLIVLLLLVLNPVVSREDCPNYGGNGNASAFTDDRWELFLPGLFLFWIILIVVEQALPATWRDRDRVEVATRAGFALFLAVSGSCCSSLGLSTVCR